LLSLASRRLLGTVSPVCVPSTGVVGPLRKRTNLLRVS